MEEVKEKKDRKCCEFPIKGELECVVGLDESW